MALFDIKKTFLLLTVIFFEQLKHIDTPKKFIFAQNSFIYVLSFL